MILYLCYRKAFSTAKARKKNIFDTSFGKQYTGVKAKLLGFMEETSRIPFDQVYTQSFDGLTLAARYYHTNDGAPLEIQFHGYRSSALCDFSIGTENAIENGRNVLAVDQRGHGKSDGRYLTFGVREQFDCISWINYAISRFGRDVKIILSGVSMGASTVLLASGLDLPENVVGIVADSPYTSPEQIIKTVCRDMHLPPRLAYPLVRAAARVYMKCDLNVDVCAAVRKSKVPLLIFHGEADTFVPCSMSAEIFKNCKACDERHTFPDAGHVLSYVVDPARYERIVTNFINKIGLS